MEFRVDGGGASGDAQEGEEDEDEEGVGDALLVESLDEVDDSQSVVEVVRSFD